MAEVIEAPPSANSISQDAPAMMEKLDDLLEQYLATLDQYQRARQELGCHMSSGFMSLAQANFSNKGRRYGQDYYDERMQAQKRVTIQLNEDEGSLCQYDWTHVGDEVEETPTSKEESTDKAAKNITEIKDTNAVKPNPQSKDPIRWFGLLVPQALRAAQANFTTAVEIEMPKLVTLQQELRHLEIEIGRTRKSIKKLGKV